MVEVLNFIVHCLHGEVDREVKSGDELLKLLYSHPSPFVGGSRDLLSVKLYAVGMGFFDLGSRAP